MSNPRTHPAASPTPTRRGIKRPALPALVAALALAMPAAASAGTYTINNCPLAPTPNSNQGSWTIFNSPQADSGSCAGAGAFIGPLSGSLGPGSLAGVQIAVPAGSGITIQQARLWWSVAGSGGATTFALLSANGNTVLQAYAPYNATSTPDDKVLPANTTSLTAAAYCSNDDAGAGCSYGSGENEILGLYGSQLTLADSTLPSGSITGGSLAGSGPVSGVASMSFTAADADSGVRYVQVLVDGKEVAQNDYIAQCPYEDFAACPKTISDTISWNSATVPNGEHDVAVRVINAAQDTATIGDHTLMVANQAAPGAVGPPNGNAPCAGETLNLSVKGKPPTVTIRYGARLRIRGLLHCGLTPIMGARVLVNAASIKTSVLTAPDGSFTFAVPKGPSRLLTFSYIPYSGMSTPSARASATVAVRPKMTLRISPRVLANGEVMHWSGRVLGGPYPASGVSLDAEVFEAGHWKVFDQLRSDRKGRFRYAYRFERTFVPTTYRFRVASPLTGARGYGYAPGVSNAVAEHVT
jgi:hypothetical protein